MSEIDVEKFRQLLLLRRDELTDIKDSAQQAAETVVLDQTRVGRLSRMDALQQQAMSRESNRRRELELRRIIEALSRINDSDYGYCVNCDEEIASNRLEVDPAATLCIDCASRLESDAPH
jgi:DnaK suppressor protein